ncbi:ABC transporter ATP-binding protein [Enterobacter cloacae]|uniref:ABC transporter ATP-binding protein n=1 Tax=Enterobacter cloacae TaxID=550 RepID=UPI001A12D353|nr:ABC transporter ATP-binding protein [Enterobacter cloacae]
MNGTILSVEHLMMHFGGIKALNDVNLDVQRGSITALIGPNGAGKTTVFNCLTGFYKASGGNILFNARNRTTNVIQVLGQKFQPDDWIHPAQLGQRLFYKMFGGTHLVNRAGLARTFQNIRLFREMSYGQQRRLEIARAMCTGPEMICLDEPAAGLNPVETHKLSNIIRFLRDHHGITVLLIEHDMGMVMEISDDIIVLDHGDVIARGKPEQIQHDEKVIAAYLGTDESEVNL